MATPHKLKDPHAVADALRVHKTVTAAARALGVSRWALTRYMPTHIQEICEYIVIEQPTTIDTHARRADSPDTSKE